MMLPCPIELADVESDDGAGEDIEVLDLCVEEDGAAHRAPSMRRCGRGEAREEAARREGVDGQPSGAAFAAPPGPSDELLARPEEIYRDLHANPELSIQEHRTAGIVAAWMREIGSDVTEGVGGTGGAGVLPSGEGPTGLLRADMDALPIKESTGLPYASDKTGTVRFGQATVDRACLRA